VNEVIGGRCDLEIHLPLFSFNSKKKKKNDDEVITRRGTLMVEVRIFRRSNFAYFENDGIN
jgi:hypothetical protein